MASIEEKVENLLKDKIEKAGYDLYDVEYVKEGKDYFLRVYIDSNNGNKEYQGILKDFDDENIYLDEAKIERKNIAQIKTVYDWN